MTRYYTDEYFWITHAKYSETFSIKKCLKHLYVLTYEEKKGKHFFTRLDWIDSSRRAGYKVYLEGTPVVFESLDHEREFLGFHPDAKNLRGKGMAHGIDACELPFEKVGNRWFWKK